MTTTCVYPSLKYELPHWKCVLHCCVQYPQIDLPSSESDQHHSNVSPTIRFHVYQHISRCTVYGRQHFNKKKQCQCCEDSTDSFVSAKLHKGEDFVIMEASIVEFH